MIKQRRKKRRRRGRELKEKRWEKEGKVKGEGIKKERKGEGL